MIWYVGWASPTIVLFVFLIIFLFETFVSPLMGELLSLLVQRKVTKETRPVSLTPVENTGVSDTGRHFSGYSFVAVDKRVTRHQGETNVSDKENKEKNKKLDPRMRDDDGMVTKKFVHQGQNNRNRKKSTN